jgi:tetratricopeptide (TPR) repeat protein
VSVGGIPGSDLFWEHLHPRAIGYYHLADIFLKEILDRKLLPSSNPDSTFASRIPFDVDQLSISWLDIALGDISAIAITRRWPFDRYEIRTMVFNDADTALQNLTLQVYRNQRTWNDGILRTAEWFEQHKALREAQTSYEAILEEYPRAYLVRYLLANLLRDQHKTQEAETQYRLVLQTNPSYSFAHVELGLLLINDGNFGVAEQELSRAVDLTEHDPKTPPTLRASAYYGLAAIRANQGQFDKALQLVDASLQMAPTYAAALQLRQQILHVTKR